ncbi:MAG: hypothetical protein AAGA68_24310 [Pseudomonadota bacterium]
MRFSALAVACLTVCVATGGVAYGAAATPCMEGAKAQFGRYVGDWKITDERLSQDGSEWQASAGARWIFECIGDGVAVQDYWQPNGGGWGTNLRTYNAETEQWDIVWAATSLQGLQRISAKQAADGSVVMSVDYPTPPQPRRIIFYPPDEGGWRWVSQWSFDEGKTWLDVYRIQATPWTED